MNIFSLNYHLRKEVKELKTQLKEKIATYDYLQSRFDLMSDKYKYLLNEKKEKSKSDEEFKRKYPPLDPLKKYGGCKLFAYERTPYPTAHMFIQSASTLAVNLLRVIGGKKDYKPLPEFPKKSRWTYYLLDETTNKIIVKLDTEMDDFVDSKSKSYWANKFASDFLNKAGIGVVANLVTSTPNVYSSTGVKADPGLSSCPNNLAPFVTDPPAKYPSWCADYITNLNIKAAEQAAPKPFPFAKDSTQDVWPTIFVTPGNIYISKTKLEPNLSQFQMNEKDSVDLKKQQPTGHFETAIEFLIKNGTILQRVPETHLDIVLRVKDTAPSKTDNKPQDTKVSDQKPDSTKKDVPPPFKIADISSSGVSVTPFCSDTFKFFKKHGITEWPHVDVLNMENIIVPVIHKAKIIGLNRNIKSNTSKKALKLRLRESYQLANWILMHNVLKNKKKCK